MGRGRRAALWRSTRGGGTGSQGERRSRRGVAVALTALALLSGCSATRAPRETASTGAAESVRSNTRAGLSLYATGDYALAARRFEQAADEARRCGEPAVERRTRSAECTAWLRARRLPELARCSERLEALQRRAARSNPGVATLIALGAIAGDRPLPGLRMPPGVRPVVKAAAREGVR